MKSSMLQQNLKADKPTSRAPFGGTDDGAKRVRAMLVGIDLKL